MKSPALPYGRIRRSRSGAAVLESLLVMVVLLLILFGFLQLFLLSMARGFADFAAFRGARSASVGFRDYLVRREAKIKAIPASGVMVLPDKSANFDSPFDQFAFERSVIPMFSKGQQYLEYEHWETGDPAFHTDYHCPYYGLSKEAGGSGCTCPCTQNSSIRVSTSRTAESVKTIFRFDDYPLIMPLREAFFREKNMDISAEAKLTNHASSILE